MLEKIPFHELDRFKEESSRSEEQLYRSTKGRVKRYRLVFLGLGVLFLILAWVIHVKSAVWFTAFAKPALEFISFAMALLAFTFAVCLRYETESVRALFHHSTHRLKRKYRIKRAKINQEHSHSFAELIRQRIALWGRYAHAKEELKRIEIDTLRIMRRISDSPEDLKTKEKLYNLALLEMKKSFLPVLKSYEQD